MDDKIMERTVQWEPKNLGYTEDADLIAQAVASSNYSDRHNVARNKNLSGDQIFTLYYSLEEKDRLAMYALLCADNCSPGFLHRVFAESLEADYRYLAAIHPNTNEETRVLVALTHPGIYRENYMPDGA